MSDLAKPTAPASVSVHWDLENIAVPRGASVIQVVQRIRDAVIAEMGEISAFYAYFDVTKAPREMRHHLAMAGLDLIDCSSTSGKSGQVDLRIIARALRTAPTEGVVIISGDSDMAYTLSQLRSARRLTAIVYDANNTASVSTALLEVATLTLPVPFAGELEPSQPLAPPQAQTTAEGKAAAPDGPESEASVFATGPSDASPPHPSRSSSSASTLADAMLTAPQRHFLDALARSPEAEPGGWRTGPCVGELFRKLSKDGKAAFRSTKKALIEAGRVRRHPDGRDLLCAASSS